MAKHRGEQRSHSEGYWQEQAERALRAAIHGMLVVGNPTPTTEEIVTQLRSQGIDVALEQVEAIRRGLGAPASRPSTESDAIPAQWAPPSVAVPAAKPAVPLQREPEDGADTSHEWSDASVVTPQTAQDAQQLLERTGSAEIAKHTLDVVDKQDSQEKE